MIKNFIKGNTWIIFAVFALIFVVLFGYFSFFNNANYNNILTNGTETTAYIIKGSATSNTTINNEPYYSIEYYFKDENLNDHLGRTSDSYTYYEIMRLERNETILIKYDPQTFESIEADYDDSKNEPKNVALIFVMVFGIADIVFWAIAIKTGKHNLRLAKVEKEGREYTATVTGISSDIVVNGILKYKIHYSWVGELGQTIEGTSASTYYHDEAVALQSAKTINIKAIGEDSVITTLPDMCIADHYNNISDDFSKQTVQALRCDYCGHHITKEDDYCSNCGAKINIYK